MLKGRNVVLVVGAGASSVYGFPDGWTLTRQIINELQNTNGPMARCVVEAVPDCPNVQHFALRLRDSGRSSIDAFLQPPDHASYRDVGRAAIAYALLDQERIVLDGLHNPTVLPQYQHLPLAEIRPAFHAADWMDYLFNRLLDDFGKPEDLAFNRVTVLTFNFDTLLEHRWREVLRHNCDLREAELHSLARRSLKVVHLNGSLDPDIGLSTKHPNLPEVARSLGDPPNVQQVKLFAKGIGLFHDDYGSPDRLAEYESNQKAVADAMISGSVVAFLGFGFHRMNVSRLGLDTADNIEFVATGMGLAEGERKSHGNHVLGALSGRRGRSFQFMPVNASDGGCRAMLRHFGALMEG